MRTWCAVRRMVAVGLVQACIVAGWHPAAVAAEAPRAPGSNTGDGSTPFTGLAKAPEANLFVGAATTAIALQVPPGRENLTPQLALTYSSSGGPSAYGTGWDLPLPRVQRSTKWGVPHCGALAAQRDFVLTLPGNTAECTLDLATGACVVAVREGFVAVDYDTAANAWTVRDRSGLTYVFGVLPEHRIGSAVTARFVAPCGGTFAWAISRVVDPHGNQIEFDYEAENGVLYPRGVRYGGNARAALPALFEVAFRWEARAAADAVLAGTGGFLARVQRRLAAVDVRQLTDGRTVRSYGFTYERTEAGHTVGDARFLSAVTLFDGSGRSLARADGLPASSTFLYQDAGTAVGFASAMQDAGRPRVGYAPTAGRWMVRQSLGAFVDEATHRDVFDIDGDAVPDLVQDAFPILDGSCVWHVHRGGPDGFAAEATDWELPLPLCYVGIRRAARYGTTRYDQIDTLDLDGDGVADLVDATTVPWTFYRGRRPSAAAGGGFEAGVPWAAPRPDLRMGGSTVEGFAAGIRGMVDTLDLIDLNGDGRLDLVQAPGDDEHPPFDWQVWYNTGAGFEADPQVFHAGATGGLRFVREDTGTQIAGIYDLTGDGLPDRIVMVNAPPNSWWVYVNQGNGFASPELWAFPNLGCGRSGLRVPAAPNDPDVVRDLFDVNGDGLPDIVDVCGWTVGRPVWQVALNRGAGFLGVAATWAAPQGRIRDLDDRSAVETRRDVFDADGDGLVDFVDFTLGPTRLGVNRHASGAWCASADGMRCDPAGGPRAAPNPAAGRPGLLRAFENGIGGTTTLEYRPSTDWDNRDEQGAPALPFVLWTVVGIARTDGMCADECDDATGAHVMRAVLTYWYGLFEPAARELRGFRVVQTDDGSGVLRGSWFHQDGVRKGKVELTKATTVSGVDLFFTYDTWNCVSPPAPGAVTCPAVATGAAYGLRLVDSVRGEATDGVVDRWVFLRNLEWDGYGNVTRSRRYGGGAPALETRTVFATDVGSGAVLDRPRRATVLDSTGAVLAEKWYAYDGQPLGRAPAGKVTTAWEWLDEVPVPGVPAGEPCPEAPAAAKGRCVATRSEYDAVGNVTRLVDAGGQVTESTYDPATRLYASAVTNPLGQRVASRYDAGCGVLISQTVIYDPAAYAADGAPRTVHAYDSFCRLVSTTAPGESASVPNRRYLYVLGAPGLPTRVSVGRVGSASRSTVEWRDEFFDAMGRRLQAQHGAVVDGRRVIVVDSTTVFDAVGNPVREYAPVALSSGAAPAVYRTPTATAAVTVRAYDVLGRVVSIAAPDGATTTHDQRVAWETTTRDACAVAGTCRGSTTRERRDASGRVLEVEVSDGDGLLARTQRKYDALGRFRELTQGTDAGGWNPATTVSTQYDSLGRKVRTVDPDSGTWRYGYDLVGNLVYEDDPKAGQHRQFCYDAGGRLVKKVVLTGGDVYDPAACAGLGGVTYAYDAAPECPEADCPLGGCAVGRLTAIEEADGGGARFCYDVRGRKTLAEVTIATDGETQRARMRYVYDRASRLTRLTYPDGEVVKYYYDVAGHVRRISGRAKYVRALTYDVFGRPRTIARGNRTTDTRTYHGAANAFRLADVAVRDVAGTTLLDYAFDAYLPTGKLTRLTDGSAGAPLLDNSATVAYDALGRVVGVDGPNLPGAGAYAYDRLGNLTLKERESLEYDPAHPHRLVRTGAGLVTHDANGNRTSVGGHTYAYDAEDRLITVDEGAATFAYDHAGRRTLTRADGQVRRYFGRLVETAGGTMTKYYYVGSLLVASQQVSGLGVPGLQTRPAVRLAGAGGVLPGVTLLVRDDVGTVLVAVVGASALAVLLVPGRRRRRVGGLSVRPGQGVAAVALVFVATSPVFVRPASARLPARLYYHHSDHLGSTHLITDARGQPVAHIRYLPYGGVRGRFGGDGVPIAGDCTGLPSCREFTGYDSEPVSGLQYAGARFYDPAVGSFLTHDPVRQFASPYSYGGGDPLNWTDPDGEFFEILFGLLIATVVSASVRAVIAAASGASLAEIGEAAAAGAVTGAVGVGLGVVAAGVGIGLSSIAGTLPSNVGVGDVLDALGEAAVRSAAATVTADAAGQVADAAGAPAWAGVLVSVVGGYLGSVAYDEYLTGFPTAGTGGADGMKNVSTTATHDSITGEAALDAGYTPQEADRIVRANLGEDADAWRNQRHFGATAPQYHRELAHAASTLWGNERMHDAFLETLGKASHYLQDSYTLGHMFPGTDRFTGPAGAPFRFLVHQTVGGEVTFLGAQYDANERFFRSLPAVRAL